MLIILTGKTASGKDTIKSVILEKYPNFKKVITTTSRTPRVNEKNNVDYYFLTREQFKNKINSGEFAEYVEYGGNLYGTYKKELEQSLNTDTLWRIDPSRAGEARDFIKRAFTKEVAEKLINQLIVIYINSADNILLERLKRRNLENEEIEKRMDDDKKIWETYKNNYDYILENVNGQLNKTLEEVSKIIESHKWNILITKDLFLSQLS